MRLIHARNLIVALAGVSLMASCATDARNPPTPTFPANPTATPTAIVIRGASSVTSMIIYLSEPTGTFQTGTAEITPTQDGRIEVEIQASPSVPNAQPIHIHTGTCEDVGPVVEVLQDVVNGRSRTIVGRSLNYVTDGNHVINIHLSAAEFATYTACGDIPDLNTP